MFIFLLFVTISICMYKWWKRDKRRKLKMPPRLPMSLPVIGVTHLLFKLYSPDTKTLLKFGNDLAEECHKCGGIGYGDVGPVSVYVVTDPEACRTVLSKCLEKRLAYNLLQRWGGDGLVTVTDNIALWKRHRKIINKAFSQQVLDSYIGTFNKTSKKTVSALAHKVNEGSFEHFDLLLRFSTETLYQLKTGTLSEAIRRMLKSQFKGKTVNTSTLSCPKVGDYYADEFHVTETTMGFGENEVDEDAIIVKQLREITGSALNIMAIRFQNVWMQNDFLYSFTSLKKREDEIYVSLNNLTNSILEKKREILRNTEKKPTRIKSFLDLLMELPKEDAFSDQELKDEVNNMLMAGTETSATLLTFALILLGSYNDVQEDVYKELKTVFGDSKRDVEKEDLSKLVLLDAVLMETLRLYSLPQMLPRYVSEDLQIKNYIIPAGSTCVAIPQHVSLNPDLWGEDSKLFRPQRWIEGVSPAAASAFAGFSVGKRNCIGKIYAMMSMKTALAHVLRHYRIDADVTKLELQFDMILKPASGSKITILPRK